MQTRTCFNGGELSPELAARADLDAYMRGCTTLENWELSQMGGVKRRRGMRHVASASSSACRILPYIYSYSDADSVFIVEASARTLRVLTPGGNLAATFRSGSDGVPEFYLDVTTLRSRQVNALLILTSAMSHPVALRWDGDSWTLSNWEFKTPPWRYVNERRDYPIIVTRTPGITQETISVAFHNSEDDVESDTSYSTDLLRASFWVEQQESGSNSQETLSGVTIAASLSAKNIGARFAIKGDDIITYWVCKQEFPGDVYVEGLDDPGNYPDNFEKADNTAEFSELTPVWSVNDVKGGGTIEKGTKFAIKSGYWDYYTCIKTFTNADMITGATSYADYPGHFLRGLAIGNAMPCRGKWEFSCSGLWYGEYEVRRSYESDTLSGGEWENAGTSLSAIGGASNTSLTGDESAEECYMRLFLTRSKRMSDSELASGFPPDSCSNRLIVQGYRHDMKLRCLGSGDEPIWENLDTIKVTWCGRRTVTDWSWAAFSDRYGYPICCEVYNQRLVFAGTAEQPQTLWASRIDDLNNFAAGDEDDAALALTMATTTQNPICWMQAQSHRLLLGTCEAEWVISAGDRQGSITSSNAQIEQHGRIGSDPGGLALTTADKVLYIERGAGRCYEYGYSVEIDGYRSRDLTVLAPHVLNSHGGATHATLLRKPDCVAVFTLADGQIALCTYNTLQEVQAWHRWVTDGRILDVCALPDGRRSDRLFLLVERDGTPRIEVVDADSTHTDADGRDYASILTTNALGNTLESIVRKEMKTPVAIRLGDSLDASALELRNNGTPWQKPSTTIPVLEAGWHQLLTLNNWSYETTISLRVTGPVTCHILAMQA